MASKAQTPPTAESTLVAKMLSNETGVMETSRD